MGKIKICLDAGHAGKYNQSPIVKSFYESDVNWKLHNLLAKKLEEYGIEVIKTRSKKDVDMELTARGKKAKGCDLFISMHVNAADSASANYVLGIYMVDDDCGQIDEQSKKVAKLLADCVADVMGAKAQTWTKESSGDRDGDGHRDDYYGVLRGAHSVGTASIILEHGFYTNKAQAEFLLIDSNLDKIAEAEAKAIADYFGVKKEETKMVTVKMPILKKGAKGDAVKTMQILLIGRGYSCGASGADGSYGSATEKALHEFKKAKKLKVTSTCGEQTWAALLGVCET